MLVVTTVLVVTHYAMALVAVVLRLLSRRVVNLTLWWDDWLALLATVLSHLVPRSVPFLQRGGVKTTLEANT